MHRTSSRRVSWRSLEDFTYLVDFGIAEAGSDSRLTMAGTKIGSLAYMAPERFNDDQTSAATDTLSLACVLCRGAHR